MHHLSSILNTTSNKSIDAPGVLRVQLSIFASKEHSCSEKCCGLSDPSRWIFDLPQLSVSVSVRLRVHFGFECEVNFMAIIYDSHGGLHQCSGQCPRKDQTWLIERRNLAGAFICHWSIQVWREGGKGGRWDKKLNITSECPKHCNKDSILPLVYSPSQYNVSVDTTCVGLHR